MFDDFDYDEYKRQFLNALKSSDVIFAFVMAMIGVTTTLISAFIKDRLRIVLIVVGIIVVAASTDLLRKNIFKHIDDKFKVDIANNINRSSKRR